MALHCYVATGGDTSARILSPSTRYAGGYRITRWDHIGPSGHTEHTTAREAIRELRRDIGPWRGSPALGIEPRAATYHRVKTEPAWLGLAVITAGVRWIPKDHS